MQKYRERKAAPQGVDQRESDMDAAGILSLGTLASERPPSTVVASSWAHGGAAAAPSRPGGKPIFSVQLFSSWGMGLPETSAHAWARSVVSVGPAPCGGLGGGALGIPPPFARPVWQREGKRRPDRHKPIRVGSTKQGRVPPVSELAAKMYL